MCSTPVQSCRRYGLKRLYEIVLSCLALQSDQVGIESISCLEIATLVDLEKGIDLCRKYGVLLGEDLRDCIH